MSDRKAPTLRLPATHARASSAGGAYFDRAIFRQAKFDNIRNTLGDFFIPESVEPFLERDDYGVPLLVPDTADIYKTVLEDLMRCLVAWAEDFARYAHEFKEYTDIKEAEANYLERVHLGELRVSERKLSVRDREQQAKSMPDVLKAQFDARVFRAAAAYFESTGKRMDKQVDVLKYLHRGQSDYEQRASTIRT